MALDADSIARSFAERGLRLTRQRRAVVDAIADADASLSALQVFDIARERCPELGLTTVYRTLEVLSEIGAVRREQPHQRLEQGRLAGAVGADHGDLAAVRDGQRDVVECEPTAVQHGHVSQVEAGRRAGRPSGPRVGLRPAGAHFSAPTMRPVSYFIMSM